MAGLYDLIRPTDVESGRKIIVSNLAGYYWMYVNGVRTAAQLVEQLEQTDGGRLAPLTQAEKDDMGAQANYCKAGVDLANKLKRFHDVMQYNDMAERVEILEAEWRTLTMPS